MFHSSALHILHIHTLWVKLHNFNNLYIWVNTCLCYRSNYWQTAGNSSITRVLKAKHAGLKVAIYLFSLFFFLHLIMRNNIYSLQYSWVHISISRVNVFCFFLPQPHWPHLHITISLLQMNWTPTWGETSPQHWIHTTNTQVWAQVSPHTHARTCMHTAAVTEFLTIWMWESFNNRGNTGAGVQGGGGA